MRVAIAGLHGRLGAALAAGVRAAEDMELLGGLVRKPAAPGEYAGIADMLQGLRPDVLLDCTRHPDTVEIARAALATGTPLVIGATGWGEDEQRELAAAAEAAGVGVILAPNFSVGAVLVMHFARQAARWFAKAEIIELHHEGKRDAPSGTAKLTAARIEGVSGNPVPIHSVRLPGLVAHQEVLFGGTGEVLTLRHDSLGRESFVAGALLALRKVRGLRGLTVGLESLLEL
ncbi:MAG TPA: dihydrodipicolinate reductase C-terminal domain-containing protein [Candidatus Dormibacteraeota bacterium]|nr:dihydrodipicolinate reductase C-terminal domain-containing protein [Candidatus Dormibacteraeota bacterium]